MTNPFRFASREFDSEATLYFMRARYFDPATGRFLSEDPLEFDGGETDFYAYVGNDPLFYIDPFGLRPLTACEKLKLKKYIPQSDLDNADLHTDEFPPKVWKFFPIPLSKDVDGITLENNIYLRPGSYDPSTPEGLALLGHELVHVGQYAREGLTRSKYLREMMKHGSGEKNKYEKPAYDKGNLIYLDLVGNSDKCCSK